MKKLMALLMFMMTVGGVAFAGGYDPCTYPAYQYCAEKLKYATSNPIYGKYCTVNPTTAEFKACQKDALARCRSGEVLDLTQKPCF